MLVVTFSGHRYHDVRCNQWSSVAMAEIVFVWLVSMVSLIFWLVIMQLLVLLSLFLIVSCCCYFCHTAVVIPVAIVAVVSCLSRC